MNIENKKTVLDDEAAIYSREERSEQEKWKDMNGKQRWDYFKSYYLMKIVAAILIIAFVGSILYTVLSPKPDLVFSLAVINSAMTQEQMQLAKTEFEEIIGLDSETQETCFDDGYYFYEREYESLQKFATYNAVGQLDATVMPMSVFEKYAPTGYFVSPAEKLPTDLYLELSPYLVECKMVDEEGVPIEGSETVMGIRIDETWLFADIKTKEPVILSINLAASNMDNVIEFLRYLFK
ncbi:MAG: hypothetical protein ACI4FZ_07300 [Lachnospiraceae bacterium]